MTAEPRVFVVHERQPGRNIDIRPALEHGELVPLFYGRTAPASAQVAADALRAKLADYDGERDSLLLIGAPDLIGLTVALAAKASGGRVRLLVWDRDRFTYEVRCATVWGDTENKENGE